MSYLIIELVSNGLPWYQSPPDLIMLAAIGVFVTACIITLIKGYK